MNKSLPELERPEFSEQEAGLLLEENYELCCTLEELPGERDQNFLAQEHNGESYVLKISNSCETLEFLKVQNNALESAAMLLEKGRIPSVYPNKNGEPLSRVRYTMLMGFRWRSIVLIPESFCWNLEQCAEP